MRPRLTVVPPPGPAVPDTSGPGLGGSLEHGPDPAAALPEHGEVGYRRDASAYNRPSWSGAKRVHRDRGDAIADCSSTIVLNTDVPVDLLALPHDDGLCRRCFPRAGLGEPIHMVVLGDRIDALRAQHENGPTT